MPFDVVIVGAGPAGLSAAIRLAQLATENDAEVSICVVEKGAEVGAHILSGAIFETRALDELIPDWSQKSAPVQTPVTRESFKLLSRQRAWSLPLPASLNNHGNYIISLGLLCRWLAQQAEALGVEIFPGFAASEVLYDESGAVCGVATGDMGRLVDGSAGPQFEPGIELQARQVIFAEGCRGSLSKTVIQHFELDQDSDPQTYGLGIKELWEIQPDRHRCGEVLHSMGWPLGAQVYGGGFVYHLENNQLAVGLITGLDYQNPWLDPFEEFQRFKTHPALRDLFEGGQRISYGARALSEGGLQSLPRLCFPGGVLVGDAAGFLNVAKLKGSHTAMKSAMQAAEAVFQSLQQGAAIAQGYESSLRQSWLWDELRQARNIRPGFRHGLFAGLANAALETYLWRGKAPWTLHHEADHTRLENAANCQQIAYPKPDNRLTFDRTSSVFLANTEHDEQQPIHLKLLQAAIPIEINLKIYGAPEQRYCPAGVYEIIENDEGEPHLQINAANCIHCKTCDIKDPQQNIQWVAPEGGSGPNYPNM